MADRCTQAWQATALVANLHVGLLVWRRSLKELESWFSVLAPKFSKPTSPSLARVSVCFRADFQVPWKCY